MDAEERLSALEAVTEALADAVRSDPEQISDFLHARARLIAQLSAGAAGAQSEADDRLRRVHEAGEGVRERLQQNRSASSAALDRLRLVSSALPCKQDRPRIDCTG